MLRGCSAMREQPFFLHSSGTADSTLCGSAVVFPSFIDNFVWLGALRIRFRDNYGDID